MDTENLRSMLRDLNKFSDILIHRTNEANRYTYQIEGRIGQYTVIVYPKWITLSHNGLTISALTDSAACDILMNMIADT